MKNKLSFLTIALFLSIGVFAQAPDLINYQAVARDLSGNPLINAPANILFEIRQGSATGTVVYSETHNSTTNQFGLFTEAIGSGAPVTGTFAGINWGTAIYYLGVTINGDAMTATQLLSVPYALHANTATSGVPGADGNDNLSVVTAEPVGANCATGGNMIEVGVDDNTNGSLEPGEIDFTYYICNGLDGAANASDTDATNELQTLSISNDTVYLTSGGFVKLPAALGDDWGSQVVVSSGANISGDGTVGNPLVVTDADNDATNELELPLTGNTTGDVLMWNGTSWVGGTDQVDDLDNDATNELELPLTGNTTGDVLMWNGTSWVGGTDQVNDLDNDATNELELPLTGNTTGDVLMWNGTSWVGGTDQVNDLDNDATNEMNTGFAVNGANLEITDGGGTRQVPLSSIAPNDGDWTPATGFIYNNTDDVTIGNNVADNSKLYVRRLNAVSQAILKLGNSNQPTREWGFDIDGSGNFSLSSEGAGTPYTVFYVSDLNRRIGMGTTNPQQNLHIEGGSSILRLQSTQSTTSASSYIEYGNTVAGSFNSKGRVGNPGTGDHMEYDALTFHRFTTNGSERMRITNSGELMLGNFTAYSQLDVNGQITMRTGSANGYIPVSNNNGTMTWTDPTTITTSSIWSTNGNGIDYQGGNVGIGTATPTETLYIKTSDSDVDIETNDGVQSSSLHIKRSLGTPAAPTLFTGAGQYFGSLDFQGALNSTTFRSAVSIRGILDGASNATNMPGALAFFTNVGNLTTPTERMRITSTGEVGVGITSNMSGKFHASSNVATFSVYNNAIYGDVYGSTQSSRGVAGVSFGTGVFGIGTYGNASGAATNNYGIYGIATGGTNNFAGYFDDGDVFVENDLRVGSTTAGGQNPQLYVNTPAAVTNNTSVEILNAYNGGATTYGVYNRLTPGGSGGVTGIWNYILPSASSNSTVYATRNLIQDNGNGTRYGLYNFINADGTGDIYGSYNNIVHDGSGDVYGFRLNAGSGSTTGNVYGLYITGPLNMENTISGNTGIGVLNPVNRLDVEGSAVIGGPYSGSTIAPSNGLLVVGDVGIGLANPTSRLHVEEITTGNVGQFDNQTLAGGTGVRGNVSANTATATGARYGVYGAGWYGLSTNYGVYGYGYGGTTAYGVYGRALGATTNYAGYFQGDVYATGTYLPSDKMLKDNIQSYEGALAKLKQINIRTYNYKQDGKFKNMQLPKGDQVGFIANELKTVFPQLTKKTMFDINEYDEKGMPIENHTPNYIEYDAVNYTGMVPVLVKAIQEQQTMIEDLKQEIEALKNNQ